MEAFESFPPTPPAAPGSPVPEHVSTSAAQARPVRPVRAEVSDPTAATAATEAIGDTDTDERRELMSRFARSDPAATEFIYNRYFGMLRNVARRTLSDPTLVDDAVQQTFVKAWKSAARYDAHRPLGPWLATIARNAAIDLARREVRARRIQDRSAAEPVEHFRDDTDAVERQANVEVVRSVIDSLDHPDRELLRLLFYEDLPQRSVAQQLGVPVGTVKSRAHRLLRRLSISVELRSCEMVGR